MVYKPINSIFGEGSGSEVRAASAAGGSKVKTGNACPLLQALKRYMQCGTYKVDLSAFKFGPWALMNQTPTVFRDGLVCWRINPCVLLDDEQKYSPVWTGRTAEARRRRQIKTDERVGGQGYCSFFVWLVPIIPCEDTINN